MADEHGLDQDRLVWMFTQMLRIREFEERVKRSFTELPGLLRGHTHLADDAEASIVGSLAALRPGDQILTTYNVVTRVEQEDANAAAGEPLSVKARAYSMPGVTVDGGDPVAVYGEVAAAAAQARGGSGPTLVESKVYRLSAHGNIIAPPGIPLHFPEHEAIEVFGAVEEYEAARRGDPVPRFRARLIADGVLTAEQADALAANARQEMAGAVDFGASSPFPEPADAVKFVYA
jgi:TPP-dependent pyruvate/acetoin dehydrogenase alpha subunit